MKWLAACALVCTLLVASVLGAALAWGVTEGIPPGAAIVIDGDRFELDRLGPALAEHWALTVLVLLLVAAVIVVVVPLVLSLALGLPLLAGALSLGLMLAPLLLLVWWLWREPKKSAKTATMPS
jgi:hypothetical protein